jgi:hypothetical protein
MPRGGRLRCPSWPRTVRVCVTSGSSTDAEAWRRCVRLAVSQVRRTRGARAFLPKRASFRVVRFRILLRTAERDVSPHRVWQPPDLG